MCLSGLEALMLVEENYFGAYHGVVNRQKTQGVGSCC